MELKDKIIKINNHYLNSGNILSKSIFLRDFLKNNKNKKVLLLVDSQKTISKYIETLNYLDIDINEISTYSNISSLINKGGVYISTISEISSDLNQIKNSIKISIGDKVDTSRIAERLNELGFKFSDYIEKNNFKISGDIIEISDDIGKKSYKISLWGNEVESIEYGIKELKELNITSNNKIELTEKGLELKDNLELFKDTLIITDNLDLIENFELLLNRKENFINFSLFGDKSIKQVNHDINDLNISNLDNLVKIIKKPKNINIITKNTKLIKNFCEDNEYKNINIFNSEIKHLKSFEDDKNIFICDDNISRIFIKKRVKRSLRANMDLLLQIKPGDYIVHVDHGVGVFKQVLEKELNGIKKEYIELQYKNDDKLFVPITEVSRINKYVGVENPKLTGLSTNEWQKKLSKAGQDVEQIAGELLEIYANRKIQKGFAHAKMLQEEAKFQNSFEYTYTNDQLNVIEEIFKDMESEQPMDRLLSGDVGFGKTEIAFNALYKSIINGKQAALISPLVVLAYEHYEKAKDRFKDFPINIEVITRFESAKKTKNILEKLKKGGVDLIIGTHRLLSEDIEFKDLGALVIDEEHKFGVKDKEKIKKLRSKKQIDILSMSATPIPRSLNMALNGIKSVSMLTHPPVGRKPIETIVSKFDDNIIKQAGDLEFERGGQLFFIHNRVSTIDAFKNYLQNIFKDKKIIVTHGQLSGDQLEDRIIDFKNRKYDILLSTTVIENGIDFSNVNTIIINQANNFGISQIHQLRGRVGRSDKKGYCYLLFNRDKIKEDAAKRLKTIVNYSHLGAGFELAIKDLEIRGGGDILGIRQSGQSMEIGINLFLEMLENKIVELKELNQDKPQKQNKINTKIELNIGVYIDDDYFNSELDKINFYREIESVENLEDLESIISDFKDINPDISSETNNLFNILKLKILASKYKIELIKKSGVNYTIIFDKNISVDELKKFLELDKQVKFIVKSINELKTSIKNFENEESFIEYLLQLFKGLVGRKKIKLKKK